MQNEMFADLARLLQQQNVLTEKLIQLGQKELEALQSDDLDQLLHTSSEQEEINSQLAELETQRIIIHKQLNSWLNLQEKDSLAAILRHAGVEKDRLGKIADSLRGNLARLQELNQTNRMLLWQSLNYVRRVLQAIIPGPQLTYGSQGEAIGTGEAMLVNKSV